MIVHMGRVWGTVESGLLGESEYGSRKGQAVPPGPPRVGEGMLVDGVGDTPLSISISRVVTEFVETASDVSNMTMFLKPL